MVKEIGAGDLEQALGLVNAVFSEFVASDYSERGRTEFENYLKNKQAEVSSDVEAGRKKVWGYYENDEILGVIATRDISHVALMFVDKLHHRKGIAKQMFRVALDNVKENKDITQMTVHSSPYAVKVYERLGFVQTDKQQEKNGIIYIPMGRPVLLSE
ncbi:MAG: GNAT family N-acetyltransferase [Oscillospiraceae bacterium]|nr:GNAT family N-acetyltransferase [Oscillospiraceae bacterium]